MAFETFDLGRVLQAGEALKTMRSQSTMDRLRERYMDEQIESIKVDRARQQKLDDVTFGKQKATQVHTQMQYVLQAQNPKNFVEQNFPELVTNLQKNGVQWETLDDAAVKRMAEGISAKAGAEAGLAPPAPIESKEMGGATIITQGGQYKTAVNPRSGDDLPTSYRESVLARSDPAYAQHLRERRGQGLSVTLPDGTTISEGGASPFALPKPTQNKLGEDYTNSLAGLQRLQGVVASFKPEYLTFTGQAKGAWQGLKAKAPEVFGKLSPQEQQSLVGYQTWRSDTLNNLNLYIKEITGAAMSEAEANRIRSVMPSTDDDPVSFQAKTDAAMKRLALVGARAAYLLSNPAMSLGDITLDRMQMIITDRANALYSGYLQQGMNEREARDRAVQEAAQQYGIGNAAAD